MEALQEAIWQALFAILVALVGLATRAVKQWLDAKGVTEQIKKKEYLAKWAVEGVEQYYKHEEGQEKFNRVKTDLVKMLNDKQIDISVTELNNLIEAMVFEMNKELKGKDTINGKILDAIDTIIEEEE